ncbi:MAG: Peptidoglycan lytic protein P45 [uncultured Sulfurovum sp.]|uniref:Peptidoglycan lytic protein P45 n=1 Tax=uncultured Sulfurovum sp. TaxID=269237 RepID=A0A6S6TH25_9BACT|nr:MAG: Peptidoglycan lytic protein P45 [uncultured Sulfurovum sp.]
MKIITFTNLMLLTSLTLFTACSKSSPKPEDKKLSTLAIIGVSSGQTSQLPLAQTYPTQGNYHLSSADGDRVQTYMRNHYTVVNEIEQNAKKLLGIKYVWGATGPSTYDCSGFTQKIYRDAGINIPRVSRDQARVGQFIAYGDLVRGDMVFFDTKKKRSGIVSHVGIYLGSGNFIHASSAAKKIVVYNFDNKSFYKDRFLWGRRVVNDNYLMASL